MTEWLKPETETFVCTHCGVFAWKAEGRLDDEEFWVCATCSGIREDAAADDDDDDDEEDT